MITRTTSQRNKTFIQETQNNLRVNFILDYLDIDWDAILQANKNNVNLSMEIFMTKITELLDKYVPLRKLTQKEYKRRFKPWITDKLLDKIEKKNKAFRKYMNCKGTLEIKTQMHIEFKIIKNEITNLTRQSKKEYYKQYFTENSANLQKIWKGIKDIINIKSKNYVHPTCIIESNRTITEPKQIANSFNKYYAEKRLKGRKYEGNKSYTEYLQNPLRQSIAIYECDQREIENIIQTLNWKKATGPNSIPTDILHLLKTEISYPLSIIFNISLNTGTHPELLKPAKVIPVFKKGSQLSTSNYRPISLLSNLNKILEKLLFNRVYNFLELHNTIYKLQFGFRQNHSINHALIDITENIRKALDNGEYTCSIFIDLQKAFDTVNHTTHQ